MFKGAKLSQVLSVTKSYLECSIWLLSVMNTVLAGNSRGVGGGSTNFDVDTGLLSTAWT